MRQTRLGRIGHRCAGWVWAANNLPPRIRHFRRRRKGTANAMSSSPPASIVGGEELMADLLLVPARSTDV